MGVLKGACFPGALLFVVVVRVDVEAGVNINVCVGSGLGRLVC